MKSSNKDRCIPEMSKDRFDVILFRRNIAALLRKNKPHETNEFTNKIALRFPEKSQEIFQITYHLLQSRIRVLKISGFMESIIPSQQDLIGMGQYRIVEGAGAPWAKIKH
ncbi:hypothetical protein K9L27_01005 [Candidatus Gracilibacteria bacterium]|nr:hypothetical protein [Candidatus Gracilibacteria bacterium]